MKVFLAIDIGASSGRHIVGWRDENGNLQTREVYRFPNGVTRENGHLVWNIPALVEEVKTGIDRALAEFGAVESLSVDTWGVDYVLLNGEREIMPVYAYRDARTEAVIGKVHAILPFSELYRRTGSQFQTFNSLYQLYDDKERGRLDGATDFLMIPEYLMWKLTGVKFKEYTNATTTGMISAATGEFDPEIISRLGLPAQLFPRLTQPGTVVGEYRGIRVVACATHDTASAVEGIPMPDGVNEPYISSGTWSLLGVKTPRPITDAASEKANYSNEGGVGYNRYQKNIMGMWLLQELRRELCPELDYQTIEAEAAASSFDAACDVDSHDFFAPEGGMSAVFDAHLPKKPQTRGDYFRAAYLSLAGCYQKAIRELEVNTGRTYSSLYIVGGGAKNLFLNEHTAGVTGLRIEAFPIEATAIGNLEIQIKALERKNK